MLDNKMVFQYIVFFSLGLLINAQFTAPFSIEKVPRSESNLISFLNTPSLDLSYKEDERTTTTICIGTPQQCFNLVIQTNSFYIWVNDAEYKSNKSPNKFNVKGSSSLERQMNTVKAKYYDYWAEGIIGNDVISIKDTSLGKMKFLIVNKSKGFNKIDGMIGLGYTPSRSESKFSFIQQLYAMKIIPHKVFAQKYHNATNGEITFGEIPKYIVEDYTNYGRCKALDKVVSGVKFKNKNWQCRLDALNFADVFRNDKVYRLTNKKVSFLEFRKRTLIPEYVFNYFKGHYFKPYLESKQCSIVKKKKYTTIKCASDVKIDNLNFVLGDWVMTVSNKDLWKPLKNEAKELILYKKENYDKFIIGRSILSHFHMVYDTQNKEIGFYGLVQYIGDSKPKQPKVYQLLKDDTSSIPIKAPQPTKPIIEQKPIEPTPSIDLPNTIAKNDIRKIASSFIIQVILGILIIIAIIVIALLALYSYVKYRRRTKFKNRDFYVQQTNAFLSTSQPFK